MKLEKKKKKKQMPSLSFSQMLPVSWFSKLKQMSTKPNSSKIERKTSVKSPKSSTSLPAILKYSSHLRHLNSAYSNLPLSPEIVDMRTGRSVAGSVEPEDDFWRFSFRTSFDTKENNAAEFDKELECSKFNLAASEIGSTSAETDILMQSDEDRRRSRRTDHASFNPDLEDVKEMPNRCTNSSLLRKGTEKSGSRYRDLHPCTSSKKSALKDDVHRFPPLNLRRSTQRRRSKSVRSKCRDAESNTSEKERSVAADMDFERRKSVHKTLAREELFSPRTMCKVKALEEIKRRRRGNITRDYETYAVAMSSFDPQKDFKDSMMEMIKENKIVHAEEMESLLACYLSLNSDEYHDVIVKVFRQVWFDMNIDRLAWELERACQDQ